jgi:amidohydrolase
MDALPMLEESGEPFASTNGAAHTCGHDFHAAMLLTAAKLLKENEESLPGRVKLMFQPAEETFEGAKDMMENGILNGVDGALAFHVTTGKVPVGFYMYNSGGSMMASVDGFRIEVTGKGAHGAMPHRSVDPINIAVHIYTALEALIAREANPQKMCVMTVGKFQAGTAANIIPETALLEGTIRTDHKPSRELLVRRMREVAEGTAKLYGGEATVTMTSGVPPLICDRDQTDAMARYMQELPVPGLRPYPGITATASEDFASIAEAVPATFMHIGAGFADDRGAYPAHNPKARFNEDVCPFGAAAYAHCAHRWLEEH